MTDQRPDRPPVPAAYALRAQIAAMHDLGRRDEVARLARQGLVESPDDPWLLAHLAQAIQPTDADGAIRAAERAVALAPDGEWLHRVAATVHLQLGEPKRALPFAERAAALAPALPDALVVLAHAKSDLGERWEAIKLVEEAVRLAPHRPNAHIERSRIAISAKDWSGAERAARRALEIDPGNPAALNNLAVAVGQLGRRTEALDLFARAAALDPDDSTAAVNARETARVIGSFGIAGMSGVIAFQMIRVGFRISVVATVVAVLLVAIGLLSTRRRRFEREIAALPAHLQHFARAERRRHLLEPRAWLGRTRRERVARGVLVLVLVVAVVVTVRSDTDRPSLNQPVPVSFPPCAANPSGPVCVDMNGRLSVVTTTTLPASSTSGPP